MSKRFKALSLAIIVCISVIIPVMTVADNPSAEGIGVSISASSGSVEAGADFSITANTSTPLPVENYVVELTYDPALVTYKGFSDLAGAAQADANPTTGKVRVVAFGITATTNNLARFNFSAKETGTAAFSVAYTEVSTQVPPAGAKASVTIQPRKSGNANLKSLSVDQGSLSPAFSSGTQNYSLPVAMGVDRIVVSAQAEDSKASVSVSGNTGLKDGANTIRVVVTAQNGSTRTYTITANRQGPTPTPEPTPTPPLSVSVDGNSFNVVDLPEGVEIPAGFYEATIEINGQTVTAYKSRNNSFILLYLSNDGPESGFYFYNEESGEFLRFAQFSVPGAVYTRIIPDESVEIPAGFVEARITIDGEPYDCWKPYDAEGEDTDAGIYLLYLLNEQGEKGFYLFQNTTRLIFPYSDIPREPTPSPTPEPTPTPVPSPTPEPEIEYSQRENPYFIVTIILAAIIVILSGVLAWLLIRRKGTGYGPGPDDENDGMGMDDNSSGANFIKPPKIRRVGAPPPDEDEEEF